MEKLNFAIPAAKDGIIVLIFIVLDIVIGLSKAFITGSYTSQTMREGLFHKLAEIFCFIFGVICDNALPLIGVIIPVSLARSIVIYLVLMEIGSVIENIGIINPAAAKYLSLIFAKVAAPDDVKLEPIEETGNNADRDNTTGD